MRIAVRPCATPGGYAAGFTWERKQPGSPARSSGGPPPPQLSKGYVRHQGFRDGFPGFLAAFILGFPGPLSYATVKELTTPLATIRPHARFGVSRETHGNPDLPDPADEGP